MANSVHRQICDAVAAGIAGLGLVDYPTENVIGADRVLVRWGISKDPETFPVVFVSPVGNRTIEPYTNERDTHSYPVTVYFVDRVPLSEHEAMDAMLETRERVENHFVNQRLAGAGPWCWGQFNSSPVLDTNLVQAFQILVEPIYFTFLTRQTRG